MVHNNPGLFTSVVYHAWWPSSSDPFHVYNTSENTNRITYYPPHSDGYRYTPYAWVDGLVGGYTYNSWLSWVNQRSNVDSPVSINLSGSFDEFGRTGQLTVSVTAEEAITWGNLKIRVALTEDSLYFSAPNGTQWHNMTMRDMIPTDGGTALTITQGQTVNTNLNFSAPSPLALEHCRLVVWVQSDDGSREVLQSTQVELLELNETAVDDDNPLPASFALEQNYPNPFNAGTTISFSLQTNSQVTLDIYDIGGRKIKTLYDGSMASGNHLVNWDGTTANGASAATGVYFYKLTADGNSLTKRMVLIK